MESWKVHLREKKKTGKEEEEMKDQHVEDLVGGERQGCEPAPDQREMGTREFKLTESPVELVCGRLPPALPDGLLFRVVGTKGWVRTRPIGRHQGYLRSLRNLRQ